MGLNPLLRRGVQRGRVLSFVALGALALASCSTTSSLGSSGMMGAGPPGLDTSTGMMGGGSGGQYHFSQVSCRAPASLP
ncbi:MAG: hypothetical protein ABI251_08780, partial [Mycobacteriaceae bacterium]